MVHENDPSKSGCEFGTFFATTPQGLIDEGIYKEIAIALHTPPHRAVSLAVLAQALGATKGAAKFAESLALWDADVVGVATQFSKCLAGKPAPPNADVVGVASQSSSQ